MEVNEKIIRVYELVKPIFKKMAVLEEEVACELESFFDFYSEKTAFAHMFGELTSDLNFYGWEVMPDADYYLEKYDWCFFKKEIHEFLDNLVLSDMFD